MTEKIMQEHNVPNCTPDTIIVHADNKLLQ